MGRKDPNRNSKKAKKKWKDYGAESKVLNSVDSILIANLQRDASLGMEYDNRGKTNSFVDRRFSGIDTSLPPEEQKYLLMQKQKQREVEYVFISRITPR
jgi:hypothetical protein